MFWLDIYVIDLAGIDRANKILDTDLDLSRKVLPEFQIGACMHNKFFEAILVLVL